MAEAPTALDPLGTPALIALLALAGEGLGALSPAGDGRPRHCGATLVSPWSVLGPQPTGKQRTTAGISGQQTSAETADHST